MSSSPTPSETPTPTPSATYKPASAEGPAENVPLPVMPAEAKVQSKEGLEAFARYWYNLINYGFETGDVEPIKAISGPECAVCKNFYQIVGPGYKNSDWIKGGELVVRSVHSNYVVTPEGLYQVLIQNVQEPLEYFGPGVLYGVHEGYPEPGVQMIEARYTADGWYAEHVVTIEG
ncbi:hypothetical protein GD627_12565 [Arthrobacter yangruifuii]|uniref:DUF6318 domain-containing protein n=1 Tax=Arthrobacter yangruifuii TaxID=2606616 RepID=A0A5N6MFM8_9MICC|nr:DUF6318 family protein [Arthrobacter yangruifuii]KAD3515127.1 hypothetical protein GD627_12565 [Arthrobacter yangruifuii]